MPEFRASSSSLGEDSDREGSDSAVAEPTRSKFWGLFSSSDEDSGNEDSMIDAGGDAGSTKTDAFRSSDGSLPSPPEASPGRGFSTPPRQPILPVDDPTESWRQIRDHQVFADPPTACGSGAPCARIVCISDTHGHHRSVPVPPCDVLIHRGDFTNYGEPDMTADVSEYFAELRRNGTVRDEIICIAGNHELTLSRSTTTRSGGDSSVGDV